MYGYHYKKSAPYHCRNLASKAIENYFLNYLDTITKVEVVALNCRPVESSVGFSLHGGKSQ